MKLVAISQRVDVIESRNERRDALDQRLTEWVQHAGYLPVTVPNTLMAFGRGAAALQQWLDKISPQAILLSGGNSIGEDVPERDSTEHYLLVWACKNRIPVLGICHGMQVIGNWAEDVPLKKVNGHVGTYHVLQGALGGISVNSYHHFALATCPMSFEVLAWSEDGEIEAISHMDLPWQGWMWHPEREAVFTDHDLLRFKKLLG